MSALSATVPTNSYGCIHSGYITVVEPYQLLCYRSNFSKLLLAGWFKIRLQCYDFHSAKQPMILNFGQEKLLASDQCSVAMGRVSSQEHGSNFKL